MTPECIEKVNELERESEAFQELTVEQLLFAAIRATDIDDVSHVLSHTNWRQLLGGFPETRWVNVYFNEKEKVTYANVFRSRRVADQEAGPARIACLEFTPGQGLEDV